MGTATGLLTPRPMTKTIGGITFEDPYAHLQYDTPEVLAWQWKEADAARDYARALPGFEALRAECAAEFQSVAPDLPCKRAGRWFGKRLAADGTGHELVHGGSFDGPATAFCSPAALGGTTAVPAYVARIAPSPDGRWMVVTILPGGSLQSVTRVVRVADGRVDAARLEALMFLGFGEACWLPDSSGFLLGDRAPDQRHRIRRVAVADAGCAVHDHVFAREQVSVDHPVLTQHVSPGGRWSIGITAPHERTALVLGDLRTNEWRSFLPPDFHGECHGDWLDDDHYVAISTHGAPRGQVCIVPVAASQRRESWRGIVPEGPSVLRTLVVRDRRLVLADLVDVSFRLRVLDAGGRELWTAPLPAFGASNLTFPPRLPPASDDLVFVHTTFDEKDTAYHLDTRTLALTVLQRPSRRIAGLHVEQSFASSRDGTRVPYFVVRRADLAGGPPAPTMLRAYGGFNLAFTPAYLGEVAPFVRCGGTFVHANLRGGGEYGSAWHDQGRLLDKQNCFDDCYAVAEDLARRGLTTPAQLVLQGASNGGLLAGVAAVQRPDLFRATVPFAPLLDMMEPVRPGAGEDAERVRSVFREDYGDPSDPRHARALYAYSPYHNIVPGRAYPAVFQVFGEHDLGCPPYHGRKFTARMRAASTSGRPVLMRTWRSGGHGGSNDPAEFATTFAEMMAFVFREAGLAYAPP